MPIDEGTIDLLIESLAVVAVTLLVVALIGWPRRSAPRCRRCGADARPALVAVGTRTARATSATSACGAELTPAGRVRWRGSRRIWKLGFVAFALLAIAVGGRVRGMRLEARGLHWRDLLPAERLVRAIEADPTGTTIDADVQSSTTRSIRAFRFRSASSPTSTR